MKKIILFFLIISNFTISQTRREVGNLVMENIPPVSSEIISKMNQYQNVRSASFSDWTNDEKMLIATRFGETAQLHIVSAPEKYRQQITFFNEPVVSGSFSRRKNSNEFLFSMDVGGGEFYQIYIFDLASGKYNLLTDGKSRNGDYLWNNAGTKFAFTSTKRNKKDFDIYLMDPSNPESEKLIFQAEGSWSPRAWSPDDSKLVIGKYVSVDESHIYLLDISTGEISEINPSSTQIAYGAIEWSTDGKNIFFVSDENSEYLKLYSYNLLSKTKKLLSGSVNWDVQSITVSKNGNWLAYTTNEGGISKLHLVDLKTENEISIPNQPIGVYGGITFDQKSSKLGLTINTTTSPSDAYSFDISTKKFTRWTISEVGGLNTSTFIPAELISFSTFDKKIIPAFITKPVSKTPVPVIINIHGGPEGQSMATFSSLTQYWVNELGCAVIFPNVRGSTGYGKNYVSLDNGFKREESVKDIGALLDWIATQPDLDKNRVAVYGGSYGGYMVLSSGFNFNDRLKCIVDIVGISNFVTFLESTQEYRRDLRRVEYGDERIPEMRKYLNDISPLTNAYKINKPLFVVQGLNDPRVPYTEAEQIVKTVRGNGVDVWYLLAKDEGHGFQKKTNRDQFNYITTLFLQNYLLK